MLCFASGCQQEEKADNVKVDIENDIQVVYNPKDPSPLPGMPKHLLVKEELCIGDEEGVEDFVFSRIWSVQVDDEENIYVLDSKEFCVKVFDRNGKHIRTFGERGQGPAQFQYPFRMHLTAGKELLIYDSRNRRISFYSLGGKCLREIPTEQHNFQRTIPDSKGNIITERQIFGEKYITEIKKFDSNLNPIITIEAVEIETNPYVITLVNPAFNVRVMKNDNIVWGYPSDFKYEIFIVNPEGKTIRKIIKDYDPVNITEEEKDKLKKARFGDRELPAEYKLEFPNNYHPYWYFICGDEGNLYTRTFEQNEEGLFRYDVFDHKGRYIAKFYLPEVDLLCVVKRNKVYTMVWEDEKGIPVVKRYTMVWE
jgi:hypothetical protein